MVDETELPRELSERVAMMAGILVARATGSAADDAIYRHLRSEFMAEPAINGLLPRFVRTFRDLDAFWQHIKEEAATYAQRRQIIAEGFAPLLEHLEGHGSAPADGSVSDALASFDADGVHRVWARALSRRERDPEGAITLARTLLETVCKRILEERSLEYDDREDLPKLYAKAARSLLLAPDQHSAEPIRAIFGGAMGLVNGIGTLRNRLSDSHGRGGSAPVRPSARHASLAVNVAGAMATFLVETHQARDP